jgi:hypothetical protein
MHNEAVPIPPTIIERSFDSLTRGDKEDSEELAGGAHRE